MAVIVTIWELILDFQTILWVTTLDLGINQDLSLIKKKISSEVLGYFSIMENLVIVLDCSYSSMIINGLPSFPDGANQQRNIAV